MKNETKSSFVKSIFVHRRIVSAVKTAETVCDRIYIVLRGCWCNIIVLNLHAPNEDKVTIQKRVFMEKYSRFSIFCLNTV